jgi:chaperonin cofactor prefoldin
MDVFTEAKLARVKTPLKLLKLITTIEKKKVELQQRIDTLNSDGKELESELEQLQEDFQKANIEGTTFSHQKIESAECKVVITEKLKSGLQQYLEDLDEELDRARGNVAGYLTKKLAKAKVESVERPRSVE